MHGGLFSYALLAGLAMALLFAAFTDLKRRQIDNWLNLAVALCAPLFWLASGLDWTQALLQVGIAAATFVVALALFAVRQMGGGDVKLITALALWFVPSSFLQLVMMMAMIGGGASVAMAFFNMRRAPGEGLRYAAACIAAFAWTGFVALIVWGLAVRKPLLGYDATAALAAAMPTGWMLAVLLAACALIILTGLLHIVRRQKSKLPIPYGVAISAAGLWILTDQYFATGAIRPVAG